MIIDNYPAITNAANKLQEYLENEEANILATFGEEVLAEMRKASNLLDQAYIYAYRINLLLSKHDTPQSFLLKLKKELESVSS